MSAGRLARLCGVMTSALAADPEHRGSDKAIIMLDDGVKGTIALCGYDDDAEVMAGLLAHLQALAVASGRTAAPAGRDTRARHD